MTCMVWPMGRGGSVRDAAQPGDTEEPLQIQEFSRAFFGGGPLQGDTCRPPCAGTRTLGCAGTIRPLPSSKQRPAGGCCFLGRGFSASSLQNSLPNPIQAGAEGHSTSACSTRLLSLQCQPAAPHPRLPLEKLSAAPAGLPSPGQAL